MCESSIVTFGKAAPSKRLSLRARLSRGPVADKFFVSGLLSGFLGLGYLGVHLWLMRSGQIRAWDYYSDARMLHAQNQLFLFLGLFILGFSFQAAGRIFSAPVATPSWALSFAVLPLLSMVIGEWLAMPVITSAGVSISFLTAAGYLLYVLKKSRGRCPRALGILLIVSLISQAVGSWTAVGDPNTALIVIWGGAGLAILAVSPQFFKAFFGGRYPSKTAANALTLLCIASLALAYLWLATAAKWTWYGWITLALIALLVHGWSCNVKRVLSHLRQKPLAFPFLAAFIWAFIGVLRGFSGPELADETLHIWATGWAATLIIALSLHISGFMSGMEESRKKVLLPLMVLWQLVPIGRGLPIALTLPLWFSWIVATAAPVVMISWGILIGLSAKRIILRQLQLRGTERMVEDA